MDKQREESRRQFESEFKRQYCNVPASRIKIMLELYNRGTEESPDWGYHSMSVQNAWEWWQASRAAIVVELPEMVDFELLDESQVRDSLCAVGLSYKEASK